MRESNVFSQHPTLDQNSLRDCTHLHREAMPALAKTLKDVDVVIEAVLVEGGV